MTRTRLEEFARAFFAKVDARSAEALRPLVTADVRLQMANAEPSTGADALVAAFKAAEERFTSIRHELQGIWTGTCGHGPVVSVEAVVHYVIVGGREVSLPVTSTLRLTAEGKVADYRIFMDPAPAFA